MNDLEEWLEEYKHLTGQHNQRLHGNRGGVKVSQEAMRANIPSSQLGNLRQVSQRDLETDVAEWRSKQSKAGQAKFDKAVEKFKKDEPNGWVNDFARQYINVQSTAKKRRAGTLPKINNADDAISWAKSLSIKDSKKFTKAWQAELKRRGLKTASQNVYVDFVNRYVESGA